MTSVSRARRSLVRGVVAREVVARLILIAFRPEHLEDRDGQRSRASLALGISDRHIRRLLKQEHDAGWPIVMALISWIVYNTVGIQRHGFIGYLKLVMFPPGAPARSFFQRRRSMTTTRSQFFGPTPDIPAIPTWLLRLAALADEYWDGFLEAHPLTATQLGDRRFNDRLEDVTPSGVARRREQLTAQARAAEELGQGSDHDLTDAERVTHAALVDAIDGELALAESDHHAYTVDPLDGPQVALLNVPAYQPAATAEDLDALLARWRAMGPHIDDIGASLRRGLDEGRPPAAPLVRRVLDQLDALLARPVADWPLVRDAGSGTTDALLHVVDRELRPAFERYRSILADEILPRSRPGERPGLVHLPGGEEVYRRLVRRHTSLRTRPQELHQTGLAEIERIDAEFTALGRAVLGTLDLASTLERLRSDPALHFGTRDEIEAVARRSLDRAEGAIPDWFGRLPKAPCEVVRMQPHEEAHSTIAYYREPAADGSRPGQFYVNTSAPEMRPPSTATSAAASSSTASPCRRCRRRGGRPGSEPTARAGATRSSFAAVSASSSTSSVFI